MAAGNAGRMSRRLAAILVADIAGYVALMGADEDATVLRSQGAPGGAPADDRRASAAMSIDTRRRRHSRRVPERRRRGRVRPWRCSGMAERNAGVPSERRMRFRIGINLGDVVHDEARDLR